MKKIFKEVKATIYCALVIFGLCYLTTITIVGSRKSKERIKAEEKAIVRENYSLLGDSTFIDSVYEKLSDTQKSEIIYEVAEDLEMETWEIDTVYKTDLILRYLNNVEYYDSIPDYGKVKWLNNIKIL